MEQNVLSVSQINNYVQSIMDRDPLLINVAVKGEISNYKVYPSGHHYFTIKDEQSALRCVMFRNSAIKVKFKPESGMQVIALGRISVYPRDGAYQLYCNSLVLDGVGDLYAAFEQLKTKLSAEGLFDPSHKISLPEYPGTIGVVTSSAGAAIHDILRILHKRYPLTRVRLLPVRVQGTEAPGEIAAAIDYANCHNLADLLIVGRGGGSIEDLWAFNDELVARAIYRSKIPVISAVGHEPDVTISDFVADVRAATPSNAAELAVPDQNALLQQLDSIQAAMQSTMTRLIKNQKYKLQMLAETPVMREPGRYIQQRRESLERLVLQFRTLEQKILDQKKQHFISLTATLDALSPLKVLCRGYAMVRSDDGRIILKAEDTAVGDSVDISLSQGSLTAKITEIKENSYE